MKAYNLPLLLLTLAGCPPKAEVGDSGGSSEADADTDADTDGESTAVLTTVASDYTAGAFATVDLDTRAVADGVFVTSSDPVVVVDEGWVFQINRLGFDSLRLYEPGAWEQPAWEISTGSGSNPYDADLCGGSVFVVLYGTAYLGVYDLATGNLEGTVDLSAYGDSDSVGPEPASAVEIDGKLYVGLQRLNEQEAGWPSEGGKVVEVDCASRAITGAWDVGANIGVHPWPGTGKILVTSEGYGEDPAGIYALDPAAGSVSLVAEFSGFVPNDLAAEGERGIAVSHAEDYSSYRIECVDLASGEVETLAETEAFLTGVAANDRGEAWITAGYSWLDPSLSPEVRIYDIATCAADGTISLQLYPSSVDFY